MEEYRKEWEVSIVNIKYILLEPPWLDIIAVPFISDYDGRS